MDVIVKMLCMLAYFQVQSSQLSLFSASLSIFKKYLSSMSNVVTLGVSFLTYVLHYFFSIRVGIEVREIERSRFSVCL